MLDKNAVELGEIVKFGNPYHGTITNGVLTLPNGTTMAWPVGSRRGCTLVALPGLPAPNNPVEDVDAGLRWDNYALLQGKLGRYPSPNGPIPIMPFQGFNYRTTSGMTWRVFEIPEEYPNSAVKYTHLRLGAYPLSVGPTSIQILGRFDAPTFPSSFFNGINGTSFGWVEWVLVPDKTGSKALAHAYWADKSSTSGHHVSVDHIQTYHRDRLLGILELTLSGGDDETPPSVSVAVLYHHEALKTETTNPDLYLGAVYVHIAGTVTWTAGPPTGGVYAYNGSINWVLGSIQPTNFFSNIGADIIRVMGACFDDNGQRVVFKERRKTWTVGSQIGTDVAVTWERPADGNLPGAPSNAQTTLTTQTDSYLEYSILRNDVPVCSGTFHHQQLGQLSQTWLYPSANGLNPGFAEADWSIIFDMNVVATSEDRSEAVFASMRAELCSPTTAVLAFRARTEAYNSPPESANAIIPARHSAVYAVAGPKSQATFNQSSMVILPAVESEGDPPFSGPLYERPGVAVPYVNVHPVSGGFAYGYASGFV